MNENINYSDMTKQELESALEYLASELEETLDEKAMMLGQSGHHVPTTLYLKKYEADINALNDKIAEVKKFLGLHRTDAAEEKV